MWKKKSKINFSQGKIYLSSTKDKKEFINLNFYDTSLRLRFQCFINIKKSSLSIDINDNNCVKINEVIGLIYYVGKSGNNEYDTIVTNAYIYFQTKGDINNFFNFLSDI